MHSLRACSYIAVCAEGYPLPHQQTYGVCLGVLILHCALGYILCWRNHWLVSPSGACGLPSITLLRRTLPAGLRATPEQRAQVIVFPDPGRLFKSRVLEDFQWPDLYGSWKACCTEEMPPPRRKKVSVRDLSDARNDCSSFALAHGLTCLQRGSASNCRRQMRVSMAQALLAGASQGCRPAQRQGL